MFPERFSNLPEYAFPRLRALLDKHAPGGPVRHMTIGEPRHSPPAFAREIIDQHFADFGRYPANEGTPELRGAIADWLRRRYGVSVDPDSQIMALNGTREGLYNAVMALCPETKNGSTPHVLLPNPFYQVYLVGALSVAAQPVYVNATTANGFMPDYGTLPADVLAQTSLAFVCSPSNPQGAVADAGYWRALFALAEQYDFKVLADECYAEIYRGTPPAGALEVAAEVGFDPEKLVVFHSLSKRSNLPGLRSGFAAGGPECIRQLKQLRAYSGAPLPLPLQAAATAVWQDEAHVIENRRLYDEKFAIADQIFGAVPAYQSPSAGFFLWLPVEDGEAAALKLWRETGVRVLPGAYLSRETEAGNPGAGYIRVALVAPKDEVAAALSDLHACLYV